MEEKTELESIPTWNGQFMVGPHNPGKGVYSAKMVGLGNVY